MNYQTHLGDCLDILKTMPDNSVDSIVTDPPYGLHLMGRKWDCEVPSTDIWAECLRVLKPGGHLLAFAGTRTQHRMAVRIEDAGFEIRDMLAWVYGSGFPKSMDVSKAIDKAAGAEREVTRQGQTKAPEDSGKFDSAFSAQRERRDNPATEAARQWQGWGTALKPALEPITLARKPFGGTVADNVLAHGTGALNIDGCRVGDEVRVNARSDTPGAGRMRSCNLVDRGDGKTPDGRDLQTALDYIARSKEYAAQEVQGRWPANLLHDGSGEVSGFLGEQARFFYCAKASKADRDEGLADAPQKTAGVGDERPSGSFNERLGKTPTAPRANHHPTVKPTNLMRYLVRLVTPPGGTVLDPFMGSGSTGKAALLEGFHFLGCEMSPDFMEIAEGRLLAAFLEGVL